MPGVGLATLHGDCVAPASFGNDIGVRLDAATAFLSPAPAAQLVARCRGGAQLATTTSDNEIVDVAACPSAGEVGGNALLVAKRSGNFGSFLDTSFAEGKGGCELRERPCPEVDLGLASKYNQRVPPSGRLAARQECCHAIARTKRAQDRADHIVNNNFYLKYCAVGPLDLEPAVVLVYGWWRRHFGSERESSAETQYESDGESASRASPRNEVGDPS
eukprot:TRINITY_DN21960_c0_g2_i1.p1 TRINITY_DN21960_c0_g2~~TRINITY_DN21960_c0_g2_i1.p1  ORF type:complete len:218 (-),score=30.73 TRINITY_DN21960_c0_g2_i1:43-696(-)